MRVASPAHLRRSQGYAKPPLGSFLFLSSMLDRRPWIFTPQIAHFAANVAWWPSILRGHGAAGRRSKDLNHGGGSGRKVWNVPNMDCIAGRDRPQPSAAPVALELWGVYPALSSGLVMIDSIVRAPTVAGLHRPQRCGRHRRSEPPGRSRKAHRMGDRLQISTIRRGER